MDSIVTMCPTLAKTDAFHDVATLRQELHRANQALLDLSQTLHDQRDLNASMAHTLATLVVPYMQGKPDELIAALDELVTRHVRVMQQPSKKETH